MSFSFLQSYFSTGAQHCFQIKELLKAQGWIVTSSSDGTTYNASGDQISSGASGADGLANNNAWFAIQSPIIDGYQKSICFQRGSNNTVWRIKYSFSNIFSGGSPGATQTPSATDEELILGSGSNASPTFGTWLNSDGTYRSIFIIGNSDEFYSFFCLGFPLGGGTTNSSFIFEAITSASKVAEDGERHLIGASTDLTSINIASSNSSLFTWFRKNLSDESFVRCPGFLYSSNTVNWSDALSTNNFNNKASFLPLIFGRITSYGGNTGVKGVSKHLRFINITKNTPTQFTQTVMKDWLILGVIAFPWNGEGVQI